MNTNDSILITGGGGFLGTHLIRHLQQQKYRIKTLSRSKKTATSFLWDLEKSTIDPHAFDGVGTIIHLAGAGIADRRWTPAYKKEIISSRVNSANVLFHSLQSTKHSVHTLISASAVGIYGEAGDQWVDENATVSKNFLGETCRQWEASAMQFEKIGIRVVILRIGQVLGKAGGVLPVLAKPVKLLAGVPLGIGNQYMSWIHIDDLCAMFFFSITNEKIKGIYNAVAPEPMIHKDFLKAVARKLHRPLWPVRVPGFLLRLILGEKATIVLEGQRVSCKKIRDAGFQFKHVQLNQALQDLL